MLAGIIFWGIVFFVIYKVWMWKINNPGKAIIEYERPLTPEESKEMGKLTSMDPVDTFFGYNINHDRDR